MAAEQDNRTFTLHRQTRLGHVVVRTAAGPDGPVVASIELPPASDERASQHAQAIADDALRELAANVAEQVDSYLAGDRKAIDAPFALGTASAKTQAVWQAALQVPYGESRTYAQIASDAAQILGAPLASGERGCALFAARALAACPVPLIVPVHRVCTGDPDARPTSDDARVRLFLRTLEEVCGQQRNVSTGADADHPVFPYDAVETTYLGKVDPKMGVFIGKRGLVDRPVQPDLFTSLVETIVGQQVSNKAAATVNRRLRELFDGRLTPHALATAPVEQLQSCGTSFRKAGYLQSIAATVDSGALDPDRLASLNDEEIVQVLSALPGLGRWSAEMVMTFSLLRRNIVAWDDLAIRRGMCQVYGIKKLSRQRFDRIVRGYTPCGTTAAIYLWAASVWEDAWEHHG